MLDQELGAGETAISYTDQFLDAAVKKIDKQFGKGFAAANPTLVQGYVHACAINLSAFMQASLAMSASGLGDMLGDMDEEDGR